jgi:predicted nucleotidyltransferase
MRTAGVVVEYNPMHNGHRYHLQKTKEETGADAIVAVMSGHFLQRGEPALLHKWARTEMALQNGADLVLELPVVYSTQSARLFAYGAVATLHALGIVDVLCFGSEQGNLAPLLTFSQLIADPPPMLQNELEQSLAQGLSYPAAYAAALSRYVLQSEELDPDLVNHPNNMLGIEYLHALHKLNSPIQPYTIKRMASGFHETQFAHASVASATAIRQAVREQRPIDSYLPSANKNIMQREFAAGRGPVAWESYSQVLFTLLARSTPDELLTYAHFEAGMETRILDALPAARSVTELIYKAKTRRYTWTRIQRALTALLLGISKDKLQALALEKGPDSIRVLGFTEKGRTLLKQSTSVASLPIVTRIVKNVPAMIELNMQATRIYALGFSDLQAGKDLHEPQIPVLYIKEGSLNS